MSKRRIVLTAVGGLAVCCAVGWAAYFRLLPELQSGLVQMPDLLMTFEEYESQAQQQFYRNHPSEKPLNWKPAEKAVEFNRTRPMPGFVLHENDCSDFTDCIVDEALGYGARFKRGSGHHIAATHPQLWQVFVWDGKQPLLPGDMISVRHSPWYPPNPQACGHVGIIGADANVYDWTKLQSWRQACYGRNTVQWFVRHSTEPGQVRIWRLHPAYRYLIKPLPEAGSDRAG
jgi:hypothetical protein